jgi:hypothetical protein
MATRKGPPSIDGEKLFNGLQALGIPRDSLLSILRTSKEACCRRLAALIDENKLAGLTDNDARVRLAAQEDKNG